MEHEESTFQAAETINLFYQVWRPEGTAKAVLLIAHGLGEHGSRYMNVVNHLVPQGYVIYALDHLGHGRSPGARGHIQNWADFREGLRAFVLMVQAQEAERPFFLMGHSMGGGMVLNYALYYADGLTAVIASAPAVGKLRIPPVMVTVSKVMAKLKPDLSVNTGLDSTAVSRDTAVVEAYQHDPLVHGKGTPGWAVAFMEMAEWTMGHAADFKPPLLLIHGDADRLVNVEESKKFFAQVKQPDKKLIIYPGGYHESHNDLHKEQVLADLEDWLEEHL